MNLSDKSLKHIAVLQKGLEAEYLHEKQEAVDQIKAIPLKVLVQQGKCWFPVMIKRVEYNKAEYVVVEIERPNDIELTHKFTTGKKVRVFSKQDENFFFEGGVAKAGQHVLTISTHLNEPPDWLSEGKVGVYLLHDDFTFREARNALKELEQGKHKDAIRTAELFYGEETEKEIPFPKNPVSLANLNPIQNKSLNLVGETANVFLLHGPPGTGKSTTLAATIVELLKTEKQILFTAPSNTAVDVMTEKLMEAGVRVLRIGNPVKISKNTISASLEYQYINSENFKLIKELKKKSDELHKMAGKYKRVFGKEEREHRNLLYTEAKKMSKESFEMEEQIEKYIVDNAQVICCTPAMVNDGYLREKKFNYLFFDEATQATEPVFWIAALKAKKIILAGDHLQLGPTVKSDEAVKLGFTKSIFELGMERNLPSIMLAEQYRMHEHIMEFSNKKFYKNGLLAHGSVKSRTLEIDAAWDKPFLFIDTAGCGYEESVDQKTLSTQNVEEAGFCVRYLNLLLEHVGNHNSVGIIAPYSAQVSVLKELVSEKQNIQISTIDGFQGQEKDIILISCVRSNVDGEIGFLKDTRRMNVAMTRARKKLIIVGDSATLSSFNFYNDLVDYAQSIEGYATAWEFPEAMNA
ncbi:MAG TPA: AAA domain-containing protein [Flavobacteriales bacterium]|nr:AAA domain-containing protein [Flavobacteriales bacterium]